MIKFNPFRPNGIIVPGIFHGRSDEIDMIERCLFQTKNGNPVHFLIQGERGIGKSSLFYIVQLIADGSLKGNASLKFLVVSVDLGGVNDEIDIVRAIGRELRAVVSDADRLKNMAKSFWAWITNWEVLGVRFHKEETKIDPQDIADQLVANVSGLMRELGDSVDGMLILIDEADRPDASANLGAFCKYFTERLTRKGCNNIVLGLAGLPSVIAKLRASHESAPRLFETMLLEPLLEIERKSVVRSGLEVANAKNEIDTAIDDDALDILAQLSEGYPHFIQQFSFSAFDHDGDNRIDLDDVISGAYKENGALSQLGDKYFSEMYHSRIASDNYRLVLNRMAMYGDEWVSRKTIIDESSLSTTTVGNALNALKARGIILADESRRKQGFYRLPTRSFAAWINAYALVRERSGEALVFESEGQSDDIGDEFDPSHSE